MAGADPADRQPGHKKYEAAEGHRALSAPNLIPELWYEPGLPDSSVYIGGQEDGNQIARERQITFFSPPVGAEYSQEPGLRAPTGP